MKNYFSTSIRPSAKSTSFSWMAFSIFLSALLGKDCSKQTQLVVVRTPDMHGKLF